MQKQISDRSWFNWTITEFGVKIQILLIIFV